MNKTKHLLFANSVLFILCLMAVNKLYSQQNQLQRVKQEQWGIAFQVNDNWELSTFEESSEEGAGCLTAKRKELQDSKGRLVQAELALLLLRSPETTDLMDFADNVISSAGAAIEIDSVLGTESGYFTTPNSIVFKLKPTNSEDSYSMYNFLSTNGGICYQLLLGVPEELFPVLQPEFVAILQSVEILPYSWWLEEMRGKGLALNYDQITNIESDPFKLEDQKKSIALKYNDILTEIESYRDHFRELYNSSPPDSKERTNLILNAKHFIEMAAQYLLFPVWAGGDWDFNGISKVPQQNPIACGWYLQKIMEALGFKISKADGMHMAQLANDEMVWSYSCKYSENLETWENLKSFIESEGYGVYFIGLSKGWGHVLFLIYDRNGQMTLNHAGPTPGGTYVSYNDAEEYIKNWMKPELIHAAKLDNSLIRRWFTGDPIYPIKTRSYAWEQSGSNKRVAEAQQLLEKIGIFNDEIDYVFGVKTRAALLQFQNENGLKSTQLPDDVTLEKLRLAAQNH